ncbi:MAG: PilW family protein [Desulfocapsaceae bacterium]|nr:PilW family protein [Desulfocapsaceae bacterium]
MIFSGLGYCDKSQKGFTLVELMMAVLIFGMVMAAVFTTFNSQQKSQTAQEAVAEMQQNLRAAMILMSQDIRETGCDPLGSSGAGIVFATPGVFQFTRDIGGDIVNPNQANGTVTDPNENVTYGFDPGDDVARKGVADKGVASLGRNISLVNPGPNPPVGTFQPIAENIVAIEFYYMIDDGTLTLTPNAAQLAHIVRVQVSLLARAKRADPAYTDNKVYTTAANTNWGPFNDNYRRKLEIITIQIRNKFPS